MAAISLWQLETIAAFLEKSRDYLDIEHTIRLHWPVAPARSCSEAAARAAKAKPARRSLRTPLVERRCTGA